MMAVGLSHSREGRQPSMVRTEARLRSLHKLAQARLSLEAMGEKVVTRERRLMDALGQLLSRSGYRVVSVNGAESRRGNSVARKRKLAKTLKCPKCTRRFSLPMHVARHVSAMHGSKKRSVRKSAA